MTRPDRRRRWPVAAAIVGAAAALLVAAGVIVLGATREVDEAPAAAAAPPATGECVVVAPDEDRELHSTPTACDSGDFSFVVMPCTDSDTTFPEPFGDARTAALCLAPNFTVGQCYRFAAPSGMFDPADCDTNSYAVIRIDAKHESADTSICPDNGDQNALPFRSLPLTYCYSSMGST